MPTNTSKDMATVAGTVASSTSRAALPFATAVLGQGTDPKNVRSTITNERGAFSFAGVAAGQLALAPEHHALAEVKETATVQPTGLTRLAMASSSTLI